MTGILWGMVAANVVLGATLGYWTARMRAARRRLDDETARVTASWEARKRGPRR